jgi:hypothetical protein
VQVPYTSAAILPTQSFLREPATQLTFGLAIEPLPISDDEAAKYVYIDGKYGRQRILGSPEASAVVGVDGLIDSGVQPPITTLEQRMAHRLRTLTGPWDNVDVLFEDDMFAYWINHFRIAANRGRLGRMGIPVVMHVVEISFMP